MNVVVERGVTRCPRCASTADYCFIECGTEAIRYECDCRMCGEQYSEENSSSPMIFSTDAEAFVPAAAPAQGPAPVATAGLVAELQRWWAAARPVWSRRAKRALAVTAKVAKDWL